MHRSVVVAAFLASLSGSSQFGPGGVGTAANNVLWLSADVGVTMMGPTVIAWNDRSGNGNHAVAPSVPAQPTLNPGILNGKPVMTFDGVDDELRIPDAGSLDMTQWDMFMVNTDPAPKTNNAWFSKGTSTQPNYALWSTGTDALAMPIYDILTFLSSPNSAAGTTGPAYNVFQYNNTVLLFIFPSRTLYRNGTTIYTDASLLQLPLANNNALYIGNAQGAAGWNLNGSIPELIIYNAPLNAAQRIIVTNYLAAKYGRTLSSNDIYTQDNPASGDYDHEMAGIGRTSPSNIHADAQGSAVVRINNPTGLGNNEFMLWGHNNGLLGSWGNTDVPVGIDRRWFREWRVSEVSASGAAVDVGNVDMTFDLTGQGPVTPSDLRLLVDMNNNGVFADDVPVPIIATPAGGNLFRFAGVNQLANGRRFTLATINFYQTPLPVELLFFDATPTGGTVRLNWATATEQNNQTFIVQRSANGAIWEDVVAMPGAGNSNQRIDYATMDPMPLFGSSYYRLMQLDGNGVTTFSDVVPVRIEPAAELLLYPDPAFDGLNVRLDHLQGSFTMEVTNDLGRKCPVRPEVAGNTAWIDVSALPAGGYVLVVTTAHEVLTEHFIVIH